MELTWFVIGTGYGLALGSAVTWFYLARRGERPPVWCMVLDVFGLALLGLTALVWFHH